MEEWPAGTWKAGIRVLVKGRAQTMEQKIRWSQTYNPPNNIFKLARSSWFQSKPFSFAKRGRLSSKGFKLPSLASRGFRRFPHSALQSPFYFIVCSFEFAKKMVGGEISASTMNAFKSSGRKWIQPPPVGLRTEETALTGSQLHNTSINKNPPRTDLLLK